jgi:hypothetical protein
MQQEHRQHGALLRAPQGNSPIEFADLERTEYPELNHRRRRRTTLAAERQAQAILWLLPISSRFQP